MFDHVTLHVADLAASERFFRTVFAPLEFEPTYAGDDLVEWDDFSIAPATAEHPLTRGLHAGFTAPSQAIADAFWRAGTEAGYRDDGAPGPRPIYGDDYYGAFLLDPDGNSIEAVLHDSVRPDGHVDHLWIRVADAGASARFYETIAPYAGFSLAENRDRPQFQGASGSFSVLEDGHVTEHLHMAFAAADNATVDAFHAAATAAGHPDNGAPGERPEYHDGYYGAFVLDPDGNNVEVVCHNR
jgi:catechol 2,3-dioxygenase-like lactoylglutathione lyase family enzyme